MDKILHDPKGPKLWELWYIPYNGSCRILSINRRDGLSVPNSIMVVYMDPLGLHTQESPRLFLILPRVSIVVPFWGLPYRILITYLVKPQKGTTMETIGITSRTLKSLSGPWKVRVSRSKSKPIRPKSNASSSQQKQTEQPEHPKP